MLTNLRPHFSRLREIFRRTRNASDETIEDALLEADVGIKYTQYIMQRMHKLGGDRVVALQEELVNLLDLAKPQTPTEFPLITMVSGVNGSGKTTTVAKLANLYNGQGAVLLASGDTYRDAAYEQLGIWAEKVGVEIVGSQKGQDAAAVVYDAISKAMSRNIRSVLIDTAGRLHTRSDLMGELKKILHVVKKFRENGPDYNLLTIDATLGQNSIQQARTFSEDIGINGLILTKFDGTAKGGAIVPICNELRLPVLYLGVGERIGDIIEFDAREFVKNLFD
jgi:fused signal recognition particle receptor